MADLGFDGKVAIVTGAGGGLGRSHALELARRGARVVVNDLGGSIDGTGHADGPAAQVVKRDRRPRRRGGRQRATASPAPRAARRSSQTAIDAFGRIDIVVNNAGILRDKAFHNTHARSARPRHRRAPQGRVQRHRAGLARTSASRTTAASINTSSNSGLLGNFGQANYGAAKMGLVGLTHVLAIEGAKYSIKANAIAPVAFTRMTADLMPGLEDKLKPELVTPVVVFLAHEDCPVTGEVYSAGGGVVSRALRRAHARATSTPSLTVEDVRDNFDQIRDETGYVVPANNGDELKKIFKQLS